MPDPKGARKRAYKPKSTTGCITRKIRRIKCDEARPQCNRCTSTGRTCDGYTSSPPSDGLPVVSRLDTVPGLFRRTLSLIPQLETSEEQESYSFFERHTVLELPGFFSSSFWQREVLQAAQWQRSIRQEAVLLEVQSVEDELGDSETGEEVPEYLRIKDFSIEYVGITGARIEFRNRRAMEKGEKGWVKHLKW